MGINELKAAGRKYFVDQGFSCAESIVKGLKESGFSVAAGIEAAAPGLRGGVGGSGCVCGALMAEVLLVPGQAKELHDRFKAKFGTTCCRALRKKVDCAQIVDHALEEISHR